MATLTELSKLLKKIEKHSIGTGYCGNCKRRKSAQIISPQASTLGENIKQFVCYLSIIMRLSFEQIRSFLSDTADLHLSDGEITACLDEQAVELISEKDRLLQKISDDYGAYTNMFKKHQLCMAHPNRKLRDLTESKTLSATSKEACMQTYKVFKLLYADLEKTLATEYVKELWLQKREAYILRLKEIGVLAKNDPQKLKVIKEGLRSNAKKYFTCLTQPGIPADNNKAERGLRHLVLKRKISYGSKSQKGADTMGVLCSTLLSAWWNKPKNFFEAYKQMLIPENSGIAV